MQTTPPDSAVVTDRIPFWSPWATIGWGLLVSSVFVLVQAAVVVAWSSVTTVAGTEIRPETVAGRAALDGDLLSVATVASAIACGVLVIALAAAKRGSSVRMSLALTAPSAASLMKWLVLTAGLIIASDTLTWILGRPIVPEFMTRVTANTSVAPLLWLALIVAAPLFEELFVRGFLLEGLRRGSLGDAGAITVTALVWASIHLQYGIYEIVTIFVFGLVLGVARIRSGSLWVPVAMHVAANLVATVEATLLSGS